jgi:predicted nucleic acid-binding protein
MHAYLDTQVIVRLATGDLKRISRPAKLALERYDLLISPMVRVELQYLHELGRCSADAATPSTG